MNGPRAAGLALGLAVAAVVAQAAELSLPSGATETSLQRSPLDSYDLPVGGFDQGVIPTRVIEGAVTRRTWQIADTDQTTLQILDPLRAELLAAGYEAVFDCDAATCGGFDFRFGTDVAPPPAMHVDIRDYRFLAAMRGGAAVSLLVSKSRTAAYVQMIAVAPDGAQPVTTNGVAAAPSQAETVEPGPRPQAAADMIARLRRDGHVILTDLVFGSGSGQLGQGPYQSLDRLSRFLQDNPEFVVVLVGHTDSVGSLRANIQLSKRRAEAVRSRLINAHKAPAARVRAEGNGYLSPIASNLTPAGREANRRVEAILLPK